MGINIREYGDEGEFEKFKLEDRNKTPSEGSKISRSSVNVGGHEDDSYEDDSGEEKKIDEGGESEYNEKDSIYSEVIEEPPKKTYRPRKRHVKPDFSNIDIPDGCICFYFENFGHISIRPNGAEFKENFIAIWMGEEELEKVGFFSPVPGSIFYILYGSSCDENLFDYRVRYDGVTFDRKDQKEKYFIFSVV